MDKEKIFDEKEEPDEFMELEKIDNKVSELFKKISEKKLIAVAILIILGMVWWNAATIDAQKADLVEECNIYWRDKIITVCPRAQLDYAWMELGYNDTLASIEPFNESTFNKTEWGLDCNPFNESDCNKT